MQSYRKALIWQKKYLTTVVRAFETLQFKFDVESTPIKSTGIERWRFVFLYLLFSFLKNFFEIY